MKDWRLGASLAVAAGCVGAFGWMLSGIWGVVNQNREELIGIHRDIGRLHANQQRILDAMQWRGGRPAGLRASGAESAIAIQDQAGADGTSLSDGRAAIPFGSAARPGMRGYAEHLRPRLRQVRGVVAVPDVPPRVQPDLESEHAVDGAEPSS